MKGAQVGLEGGKNILERGVTFCKCPHSEGELNLNQNSFAYGNERESQ
jgi:hypothetical protein